MGLIKVACIAVETRRANGFPLFTCVSFCSHGIGGVYHVSECETPYKYTYTRHSDRQAEELFWSRRQGKGNT